MAEKTISALAELAELPADADVLAIDDVSASTTKKVTVAHLRSGLASNASITALTTLLNSHDHSGGDGGTIAYDSLSGKPTIPTAGTSAPLPLASNASAGTSTAFSREDHAHATPAGKADKVASATAGHLATLDSDGNLADSGYSLSSLLTVSNAGATPHVGDVGTPIILDVDEDITGATAVGITYAKPSGATGTWTAMIYIENGEATYLRHDSVSGDLDEIGTYSVQPEVTLSNGTWRGGIGQFSVLRNL